MKTQALACACLFFVTIHILAGESTMRGALHTFKHLNASGGPLRVVIHSGQPFSSIVVAAEQDQRRYIHVTVHSKSQTLEIRDEHSRFSHNHRVPTINVFTGGIESMRLSGLVHAQMPDMKQARLSLDLAGHSQFTGSGTSKTLSIHAGGATRVFNQQLISDDCAVVASGLSHQTVRCQKNLVGKLSGMSLLQIIGHPHQAIDRSGRAKIRARTPNL